MSQSSQTYLQTLVDAVKLGILTKDEARQRLDSWMQQPMQKQDTEDPKETPNHPYFFPQPNRRAPRYKTTDNVFWLF